MIAPPSHSPFATRSQKYNDAGLCIVPIAPGTKKPGEFTAGEWRGLGGWDRFFTRLPSELEMAHWDKWPDAGIGLICGKISGVVAVDVDTDDKFMLQQLAKIMPPSPVRKKGRKGFTAFYKYGNQLPRSWDVNKERIVDLLSDGRQTVMPGTQHPDGMSYVYLTEDALEDFDLSLLPELPRDFESKLDFYLGALQTSEDKAARRAPAAERDDDPSTILLQSIASRLWREINAQALHRLDEWVPMMIPGAKPDAKGYRCRAFWRDAENPNVGITRSGIRDFGGGIGLTPIDLVMYAQNVRFDEASESLRKVLRIGGAGVSMTINGDADAPMPDKPKGDLSIFKPSAKQTQALPTAVPAPAPRRNLPPAMPRNDADPMAVAMRDVQAQRVADAAPRSAIPDFVTNAPGLIGQIADWINATAPKPQPEFAVAAALVIGCAVMGRRYRTDQKNFPSLYFVMIAKSAEGKDHPQKCVRKVLAESGLEKLIGGSGYTSDAGVMTALQTSPSHVAIIDEIGQMMAQANNKSNANLAGAVAKLLEVFSSCDDLLAPKTYSGMTIPKSMRNKEETRIFNPAVTILGATTPDQFFGALNEGHTEGGFMGRLILIQTTLPRRLSEYPVPQEPSSSIIDWCKEVVAEHAAGGDLADVMSYDRPAKPVPMRFAPECRSVLASFEQLIMDKMEAMENPKDDVLLGRTREKAMRLAMVVAKMTNAPRDNVIKLEALEWAIRYVSYYDFNTAMAAETRKPVSKIEEQIVRLIGYIKKAKQYNDKTYSHVTATGALPRAMALQKMKVDKREFNNILDTAVDAGRVTRVLGIPDIGYGGEVYYVRGAPD